VPTTAHYAVLAQNDTLYNIGWDGITADALQTFDFSVLCAQHRRRKNLAVGVARGRRRHGGGHERIKVEGQGWNRYALPSWSTRRPSRATCAGTHRGKEGSLCIDMVSLLPHETFKGHGLRKDLAEAIAALHPALCGSPAAA
jgi:hypothetical protein